MRAIDAQQKGEKMTKAERDELIALQEKKAEIRLSQMTTSTALAKERAIMEANWKEMLKHFIGNAKVTQLINIHL